MIAIAIDGPSGAGKSTIARKAAARCGFTYIDTGALYRCIALSALREGIGEPDEAAIAALLPKIKLDLRHIDQQQHVFLGAEDVSQAIRSPEVSMAASKIAALPCVREFLLGAQRRMAEKNNVIMDGRDIGSVVLPNAQIKIFLTASSEERARRRYEELLASGEKVTYESVLHDVVKRDQNDTTRAAAPLKAAPDAITVDTTGNTLEESVELLTRLIENKLREL